MAEFAARYSFPLDPFQLKAIRALQAGNSVLVTAPTGTGKTVVAEFAVFRALRAGLRAIYTTPLKALSNQKYLDFRAQYGDNAGLVTGDVVLNLQQGRVLVMTTEVLRNMLIQGAGRLNDVGCVIFDEIHYLADQERGTTWEEAILCLPPTVPLVCLTATLANAGELAAWISSVHPPVRVIEHLERAVPLEHYYYLDGELRLTLNAAGGKVERFPGVGGEGRQAGRERTGRDRREPSPREIVEALDHQRLLPCLYFLFSRRTVEQAAFGCSRLRGGREPPKERPRGAGSDRAEKTKPCRAGFQPRAACR